MTPYLLDLPAVVSFSGGRTSGFMLRKILDAHGGQPEGLIVSFQNTGLEHAGTYDFVGRVAREWGVNIVWLEYDLTEENRPTFKVVTEETASRNGEPYDKLISKKRMLSHPRARLCTGNMKIATLRSYMRSHSWTEDGWVEAVGLRADEPKRALSMLGTNEPSDKNHDPLVVKEVPLYRAGVYVEDVMGWWAKQTFDLELPVPGNLAGNCVGCHLKGRGQLEMLMREMPEYFDWWVSAEKRIRTKAGHFATFRPRSKRPTYEEMLASATATGDLFPIDAEETRPCHCTD